MSTQLVIFDFDGTLFDTHASISHCIKLTFDQHSSTIGNPPSESSIHRLISSGAGLEDTFSTLHPDPASFTADKDAWISTYRSLYASEGQPLIKAFPGAQTLLADLSARSVPCAIVSNKGVAAVITALKNNGLEHAVPAQLIVGDNTPGATRKPDTGSYVNVLVPALKDMGAADLEPQRVLVVGDTAADVKFAANLGAKAVWCRYGYGDRSECEALGPAYTVDELEEIGSLVRI